MTYFISSLIAEQFDMTNKVIVTAAATEIIDDKNTIT